MKIFGLWMILFALFVAACSKPGNNCNFPTFACLQGNWIEKESTDSSNVKESIQVYMENNRQILYDWTAVAELQMSQLAIGKYYFGELPGQDSVSLTSALYAHSTTYHWYLKMISNNEIEIDYGFPPGPPPFKKRYVRE
ncbi:hypothetical protein [Puia dinghuensis]|uniref:Lipoprotein n=1 Tax=Puia dinghuensis TaxID=1792502 RepID=A0A8J2XQW5_9BACT|nr:hypothetical protein [Puia dinghuensis]GGA84557.1 hypothetical protein GCM10011511_04490 [Puia dinghuensis]